MPFPFCRAVSTLAWVRLLRGIFPGLAMGFYLFLIFGFFVFVVSGPRFLVWRCFVYMCMAVFAIPLDSFCSSLILAHVCARSVLAVFFRFSGLARSVVLGSDLFRLLAVLAFGLLVCFPWLPFYFL